MVNRTASYKLLTICGTLSSILCYTLLTFRWNGNTSIWESLYIFPGGFGCGIVISTTFIGLTAGIDQSQMAIASTGLYLSANIGTLVAASLTSNILMTSLRQALMQRLTDLDDHGTVCKSMIEVFHVETYETRLSRKQYRTFDTLHRSMDVSERLSFKAMLKALNTHIVSIWKSYKTCCELNILHSHVASLCCAGHLSRPDYQGT